MSDTQLPEVAPERTFTVSFPGDMWRVRPRRLWQQLFNHYREIGGDLNNLDNMLIDFENCKQVFDQVNDGPVEFLWGCSPGSFVTAWISSTAWKEDGLAMCVMLSSMERFLHCELTADEAKFTAFTDKELWPDLS